MNPRDRLAYRGRKVLLFGEPKSGKSRLAATLAKYFQLYWLDLENGSEVINQIPNEYLDNIQLSCVPDTLTNTAAQDVCKDIFDNRATFVCDEHGKKNCPTCKKESKPGVTFDITKLGPNDVLVIDSLTQLSESALNKATADLDDSDKIEFSHWDHQGAILSRICTGIQNARCNIVVITHEAESEGADKEKLIRPMGGTRNFAKKLAKYFDDVVYLYKRNKSHRVASGSVWSNNIMTGTRADVALETLDTEGSTIDECDKLALIFFRNHPNPPAEMVELIKQLDGAKAKTVATTRVNLGFKKK